MFDRQALYNHNTVAIFQIPFSNLIQSYSVYPSVTWHSRNLESLDISRSQKMENRISKPVDLKPEDSF